MKTARKTSALILVLFIALSSLTVLTLKPANAQPMPTIPVQTVQLGEDSTPEVSSPTFIPVMPTFVWFAIVAVLGSALVFVAIIKFRRFNDCLNDTNH